MRLVGLLVLILSIGVANTAERESDATQTYLEVPSARVKLPPEVEGTEEVSERPGKQHLILFLNRKLHRIEEVGDASARVGKTKGSCWLAEYLVPNEVSLSSVVDGLATQILVVAHIVDEVVRASFGVRDSRDYQIRSISETANSLQYQVVASSPEEPVRTIWWVAIYWRSDRVVVLGMRLEASREDEQRFATLWNALNSSFEWRDHQK